MECYEDARFLAEIQFFKEDPSYKDYASRIKANAEIVEKACLAFPMAVKDGGDSEKRKDWPTPTEHLRFSRIYYLTWASTTAAFGLSEYSPELVQRVADRTFATASRHELKTFLIFMDWLVHLDKRDETKDLWMVLAAHNYDMARERNNGSMADSMAYGSLVRHGVFGNLRDSFIRSAGLAAYNGFYRRITRLPMEAAWTIFRDGDQHI
ncbi:MAG: hypothetical protein Q9168_007588 [Polycauliona sp. 1 TL-2023]